MKSATEKQTRPSIITLPDPRLRSISQHVPNSQKQTSQRVASMLGAIQDWEASRQHEITVALAAVQIGIAERVIVVRQSFEDKQDTTYIAYLNPTITRYEGKPEAELEGCLSVKDMYIEVPRYPKVKIKATLQDGTLVKFVVKGFAARVFQHEIDHTYGITTVDRATATSAVCRMDKNGHMIPLSDVKKSAFFDQMSVLSAKEVAERSL